MFVTFVKSNEESEFLPVVSIFIHPSSQRQFAWSFNKNVMTWVNILAELNWSWSLRKISLIHWYKELETLTHYCWTSVSILSRTSVISTTLSTLLDGLWAPRIRNVEKPPKPPRSYVYAIACVVCFYSHQLIMTPALNKRNARHAKNVLFMLDMECYENTSFLLMGIRTFKYVYDN